MDAAGRAADNNADEAQIQKISALGNNYIQQEKASADIRLKEQQIEIESADKEERRRMEWAKIDNEVAQLEQRKREDETKRLVAAINKN